MAANKATRSIHLAQPVRPRRRPQPVDPMPVKAHIYRTIAEMNVGLEQAIQGLRTLQQVTFFSLDGLSSMHNLLSRVRAQANRQLIASLNQRETANAEHFQRLCTGPDGPARLTTRN